MIKNVGHIRGGGKYKHMFVVCSLIVIPFIGAIHVALTGVKCGGDVRKIRKVSLMYTCFTYYISIMMWIEFDPSNVGIQIVSEFSDWEMFNIAFGVDGLSLFFVILTALTIPIAIISGYYMGDKKQKLYLSLILLFSGFIISVFLSLDLIIFYVSFEAVLIPLTLLVGIYGGWRRISAAYQLFVRHCRCICQVCITDRNFHHITTRSESGQRGNRRLNRASLLEALKYLNKLTIFFAQRVLSKVKTILFEIKFPVPSQIREQFCFDGLFKIHVIWGIGITWVIIFARSLVKWIKGMSWWPKESKSTNVTTMGWPKGCKTYGHRVGVVPNLRVTSLGYSLGNARTKGRPTVFNVSDSRSYSTGGTNNVADAIDSLAQHSREKPDNVVDRKLYKMLCSEWVLIIAYNNIKSVPGNITPGKVNEGISNEFILKLSQELRSETFQFTPSRGIQVTQAKGGARPLTIAYLQDKIVQEAIRIILNAIYEPTFIESSHGFRPNRGCHTALEAIKRKFKSVSWIMVCNISKSFDSIDHQRLMNLIENKILDRQFTKLIRKSLRCGYFEFARYERNIVGTPQGSIISPILSNIYIHQLDVEIQKNKDRFDRGTRPRANDGYKRMSYLMIDKKAKITGDFQQVQERFKELQNIPYTDYSDPLYRRLNYVRYADSWVVGIRGSNAEAREVIKNITIFCNHLGITINKDKTQITNIITETAVFLGTNIQRSSHQKYPSKGGFYKQRFIQPLNLTVSLDRIRSKLHQTSFIKNGQPSPRYQWISLNHRQILVLYNSVYRGFTNYYSFALNYNDLASLLQFVLKSSCAKLLAAKYSLDSQAKVYKMYGSGLTDPVSGETFVKPED